MGLRRARFMKPSFYHELAMGATERAGRDGGWALTSAKNGLDVADCVLERREPRSRGRSRRGAEIVTPVGFDPASGAGALSVPAGRGALAIEEEIGRKAVGREPLLSDRLGSGRLVAVLLSFEDDALVELGERQRHSDLRQGENGVGDQDFVRPGIAGAGVDGGADGVLFEHDVALDGRSGLILAGLDDPVVARGAWAEHFEDDDGIVNDGGGSVDRGADDHAVGIADVALRDLKFEVAAVEAARLAAKSSTHGDREVSLDVCVTGCSTRHGDGADAVEFVAHGLPFLPFEEFGEGHGFAQGKVHGTLCLSRIGDGRDRAASAPRRLSVNGREGRPRCRRSRGRAARAAKPRARSLTRVSTRLTTATTAARSASSDLPSGALGTRRISSSRRAAADPARRGKSKRRCWPIDGAPLGQRLPKRMTPER